LTTLHNKTEKKRVHTCILQAHNWRKQHGEMFERRRNKAANNKIIDATGTDRNQRNRTEEKNNAFEDMSVLVVRIISIF